MICPLLRSTLFPYTTLFRSVVGLVLPTLEVRGPSQPVRRDAAGVVPERLDQRLKRFDLPSVKALETLDRKSTRLNSSHTVKSYAVFCLENKDQEAIQVKHVQ